MHSSNSSRRPHKNGRSGRIKIHQHIKFGLGHHSQPSQTAAARKSISEIPTAHFGKAESSVTEINAHLKPTPTFNVINSTSINIPFLSFNFPPISLYTKMATRRIPALCLAHTGRNVFLTTSRAPRFTPRSAPLARQFQTSSARREQQQQQQQQQANVGAKRDPAPKITRGGSKVFKDADAAVADLRSGSTIPSAGFGLCGTAGELLSLNSHSIFSRRGLKLS